MHLKNPLPFYTMSCCDDVSVRNQTSATHMHSVILQGSLNKGAN